MGQLRQLHTKNTPKTSRRVPLTKAGPKGPSVVARNPRSEFSDEEWHDMVATAAYYLAEGRGFEGGSPDEDWYEAEAQLREQFAAAQEEADEKEEVGFDLTAHQEAVE